MNTQSEDNYLVLICIFRLERCKKNAKEGGESLLTEEQGACLFSFPHEHTFSALTNPEIWLFNCCWPSFSFCSFFFFLVEESVQQSCCFCLVLQPVRLENGISLCWVQKVRIISYREDVMRGALERNIVLCECVMCV